MEATQPDNLNTPTRIDFLLSELRAILLMDSSTHDQIRAEMRELEQLGIINASTHFQQGKYLYVIYPMVRGQRKRVYVGSDRVKIAATEAAIKRGERYRELARQLYLVEHQLANLTEELDLFVFKIKEGI